MKQLLVFLSLSLLCLNLTAQEKAQEQDSVKAQEQVFIPKELTAQRISEKVDIDGLLDEAFWHTAEIATDFTNWQPEAGKKPKFKTEVRIVYDDDAIYMGATMYTDSRADIMTQLTARDQVGNTDFIGIIIDTYGNGTQGFEFLLCATGVQFDANVNVNGGENSDWNEVWYSEVNLTDKGWTAEIKIPYSALRFATQEVQNWRVNFMRSIPSKGEKCSFQYIDPEVPGFVNQSAFLKGIENIKAPLRLSLSPYVTGYVQTYHDPASIDGTSTTYSYNGGLDLKYGINDAFTLDMTLIPDFGQVQSDDQVLNLSPFEVRFAENRAFFTEGVDIFNKANLFYSRRVGGIPVNYWDVEDNLQANERIVENPGETQLYNATKISGRTNKGLGIGFFNAISGSTEALIKNEETKEIRKVKTAPLTNYNVTVLDKNLANNSYLSFTNTNVWRRGADFYDANVIGTEFNLKTKGQNFGLSGTGSRSSILNGDSDNITGNKYNLQLEKISGVVQYSINASGTSPDYDRNDLGFNTQTNIKEYWASAEYYRNEAWKFVANGSLWFNTSYNTTYTDNAFQSIHFNGGLWAQLNSLWSVNIWSNARPTSHDYFEPRIAGRYLKRPGYGDIGLNVSSDNRKKFRTSIYAFGRKYGESNMNYYEYGLYPRYRFNDHLTIYASLSFDKANNTLGWVDEVDNEPIIGRRIRDTYNNVLGINYTFNHKMSLEFRSRHYWSKVRHDEFYGLALDGELLNSDYEQFRDFSYNSFNIDLNYRWRFAPGSDLILNWKNAIQGGNDDPSTNFDQRGYFDGAKSLSNLPESNSFSLRIVYFLNGQDIF